MSADENHAGPRLRPVAPVPRSAAPRVLVLGGGVIGLACARELARRGAEVEVVERLRSGAAASTAAAGMLSPLLETSHSAPLLAAGLASRDAWSAFRAEIEEESGLEIDYDDSGAFLVALEPEEEAELEEVVELGRRHGEPVEEADLGGVRQRVPDLAPAARRALLLPGEHRVDNVKLCAALAVAAQGAGAILSTGLEVKRVETGTAAVRLCGDGWRREADLLLLAAGAWSGRLPGLPALPVQPVRGQMLLLGGVEWEWAGTVRRRHRYTVRRGLTGLLVGATLERTGFRCHTSLEGQAALINFARELLPGLAEARIEASWAGLRPGTPDDLPLLGRLGELPVVAATGHYRNGILLTPWTARAVADLVLDGVAPPEAAAFDPGRFAAD